MVSPARTGAQHPQHLGSSISASFRVACMAHTRGNSVRRWAKQRCARAEAPPLLRLILRKRAVQ